jgi:hypothetical protein
MTSSDSNTVSAVITRDILPVIFPKIRKSSPSQLLTLARITTFSFTFLTIVLAMNFQHFGGVFGLIVSWFASLLGPIAIPMILGLLPAFKRSGGKAAIVSITGGLLTFAITKMMHGLSLAVEVSTPMLTSLLLYILMGYMLKNKKIEQVEKLLDKMES